MEFVFLSLVLVFWFIYDLYKVYLNPLRASVSGPEPLCSSEDLRNIFSNLEAIMAFHFSLLKSMRDKVTNWSADGCLGEVFLYMVRFASSLVLCPKKQCLDTLSEALYFLL